MRRKYLPWSFFLVPVFLGAAPYTVTNNNDAGAGSLRQAITDSNNNTSTPNTITLNPSLGTITLASHLPHITQAVTITGPTPAQTINGADAYRCFFIESGTAVSLSNMNTTHCKAKGGDGSGSAGGGMGAGAALFVKEGTSVTVTGFTFSACQAVGGTGGEGYVGLVLGGGGGGGLGGDGGQSSSEGGGGGGGTGGRGGNSIGRAGGGGGGAVGRGGDVSGGGGGGGGGDDGNGGDTGPFGTGIGGGGGGGGGKSSSGSANGGNVTNGLGGAGGGGASGGGSNSTASLAGQGATGSGGTPAETNGVNGEGGGGGNLSFTGGTGGAGGSTTTQGGGGGGGGMSSSASGGAGGKGGFGSGGGGGGVRSSGSGGYALGSGGDGGDGRRGGGGGGVGSDGLLPPNSLQNPLGRAGVGTVNGGGGGGGGVGGDASTVACPGGDGGFGGGGGGAGSSSIVATYGGNGGFGGGGGGTSTLVPPFLPEINHLTDPDPNSVNGANGGFGGGGASGLLDGVGGSSLFGGGTGANGISGDSTSILGGGGGAAFGGAIFIQKGGVLTLVDPVFSGNSVTAGVGGTGAGNGIASGLDIFMMSGATLLMNISSGTFSLVNPITSDAGAGGGTGGGLIKLGAGTLIFSVASSYTGETLISQGALQGNTTTLPTAITDNAELIFNQTSSATYAGVVSGTGQVTKTGAGALTFSSAQSYTGGTVIQTGSLLLTGSGSLSSAGALNLAGASTLFDVTGITGGFTIGDLSGVSGTTVSLGSNNLTVGFGTTTSSTIFGGVIQGVGCTLTKQGGSTLTFTGANTYSGGTFIASGTLALAGSGSLFATAPVSLMGSSATFDISGLSSSSVTLNAFSGVAGSTLALGSKTFIFQTTALDAAFSGNITGSGGTFIKQGTGTLTLTGNTNSAVNIRNEQGTLIGNSASLAGNIYNAETLFFNQNIAGSYSNTLSGTGSLTKQGTGTLTLSTGSVSQNTVTVDAGTLVDNVVIVCNSFTVNADGTIKGTGPIHTGSLVNYGTVVPGNSIGKLTIDGPYTQAAGSLLQIEVKSDGTADQLNITGPMVIESNTTLQVIPDFGDYNPTTIYTIVKAANIPSTSRFTTFQNDLPTVQLLLNYTSTTITLSFNFMPFHTLITNGNIGNFVRCLDSATVLEGSDLQEVIDLLRFMPYSLLVKSLTEIQPSQLTALPLSVEETLFSLQSHLSLRLRMLYNTPCAVKENFSVWAEGLGGWGQQHHRGNEVGFKTITTGGSLGVDVFVAEKSVLGAVFSYADDRVKWAQERGHGHVHSFYPGLYGGMYDTHFYVEASVLGGPNFYTAERTIHLYQQDAPSTIRRASHTNRGWSVDSHVEVGAEWGKRFWVRPSLGGDFFFLKQQAFTETGADSLDLAIQKYRANGLQAEAALELGGCLSFSKGSLLPYVKIGTALEQRYQGRSIHAHLVDQSCIFSVKGLNPDRLLFTPACGLMGRFLDEHLIFSLDYEGAVSHTYLNNTFSLNFQWLF